MAKIPIDDCPAGAAMDTAVARALGWGEINSSRFGGWCWRYPDDATGQLYESPPAYSADIAAAWEIEGALSIDQQADYVMALFNLVTVMLGSPDFYAFSKAVYWRVVHASPLDRCRAFLKVHNIEFVEAPDDQI